jgi:hypothetical protein
MSGILTSSRRSGAFRRRRKMGRCAPPTYGVVRGAVPPHRGAAPVEAPRTGDAPAAAKLQNLEYRSRITGEEEMERHLLGSHREVRLEGIFDAPAVGRIRQVIESARPSDHVRVDLTRVRDFQDFGVAALADILAKAPDVEVEVLGLRQHHVRLLRYLGAPAGVLAAYRVEGANAAS